MSGDRGGGPDAARRATAARFFRAAEQGDLATLRALAAERPALVTLERAADDERTALHYAVLNRDAACARFLLSAGADPRKGVFPHRDATAPLTLADERGYDDIAGLIRSELAQRAARAGAAPPHAGRIGAVRPAASCSIWCAAATWTACGGCSTRRRSASPKSTRRG